MAREQAWRASGSHNIGYTTADHLQLDPGLTDYRIALLLDQRSIG